MSERERVRVMLRVSLCVRERQRELFCVRETERGTEGVCESMCRSDTTCV